MEVAIGIAIGSNTQIALFVTPLLVLLSFVIAQAPLTLAFTAVEVFLVLAATFVAANRAVLPSMFATVVQKASPIARQAATAPAAVQLWTFCLAMVGGQSSNAP